MQIDNSDGEPTDRAVIKASGQVVIDGSNPAPPASSWSQCGSTSVYSIAKPSSFTAPHCQVFVGDVRYDSLSNFTSCDSLQPGQYAVSGTPLRLYVNAGGPNPGSLPTYLGVNIRTNGFDVDSTSYLTIDGFIIERTAGVGIRFRGSNETLADTADYQGCVVTNCTSRRNWRQGILIQNCSGCTVERDTTHDNGSFGILLHVSTRCKILSNTSYANDDPQQAWGGIAGIKIGNSSDSNRVSFVTVDYNTVYNNEDSGIDLRGAKRILVRRNISHHNGDHGYDNNATKHTWFMNNVALSNNHNGLSVEENAYDVEVYNSIFAYNAIDATTLATDENIAELWVHRTSGFKSKNNLIVGRVPRGAWPYPYEARERTFVEYGNPGSVSLFDTLTTYQSITSQDSGSVSSNPLFTDTLSADFTIGASASQAIDRARTNMRADPAGWASPWWLPQDPRGFSPHDNDSIPNNGFGIPAYAEIGAYEYDIQPAPISDLAADIVTDASVHLTWTATGDDSLLGTAATASLKYNETYPPLTETNWEGAVPVIPPPAPGSPGTLRGHWVTGLPMCTLFYFGLRYGGGNDLIANLTDTDTTITTGILWNGQWVCEEGARSPNIYSSGRTGHSPRATSTSAESVETASEAAGAIVVQIVRDGSAIDVMLLRESEEVAATYAAGGGVVYQVPDEEIGWTTRLRYDLSGGNALAVMAPKRSGRWVFLEPLTLQAVPSAVVAHGMRWRIDCASHSRLGDVSGYLTLADQIPELGPGDTLAIRYVGEPASEETPTNWLVLLRRAPSLTSSTEAGMRVREPDSTNPVAFALRQNQPNPFDAGTAFSFDVPTPEIVRLEVFDLMGRRMAVVHNAWTPAGRHSLAWNGRDARGTRLRPGAYVCRFQAGSFTSHRKLVVVP